MSVPWNQRWWLDSRWSQAGTRPGVLLLSCDNLALMTQLVAALYHKCADVADPEGRISRGDASPPRVAVFIDAYDGSGQPPPWQGHGGDVVYDSPAAYRILGFVSVDP
jgi:hypothetical protein